VINKKGTSLVEVLIALFILVISGTAITTLLITSMHAASISAEKLVATNLAREGIEGVTNMVNTNWLRFPSDSDCWDEIDAEFTEVGACDGEIATGDYYILKLDGKPDESPFKWTLKSVASDDDVQLGLTADTKPEMGKYCMRTYAGTTDRTGLLLQGDVTYGAQCTKYYRQITVKYFDSDDDGKNEAMEVTSKVQWLHSSEPKTVEATTTLYNEIY